MFGQSKSAPHVSVLFARSLVTVGWYPIEPLLGALLLHDLVVCRAQFPAVKGVPADPSLCLAWYFSVTRIRQSAVKLSASVRRESLRFSLPVAHFN